MEAKVISKIIGPPLPLIPQNARRSPSGSPLHRFSTRKATVPIVSLLAPLAVVWTIQCMNSTYRSPELAQHIRNLIAADARLCAPTDGQLSMVYLFTRAAKFDIVAD